MDSISVPSLVRNEGPAPEVSLDRLRAEVLVAASALTAFATEQAMIDTSFEAFEHELRARVPPLARAVISLFLALAESRVARAMESRRSVDGRVYRRAPAQWRNLMTCFGVVRYRRTYMRELRADGETRRGFHPLDAALGLWADRVSPSLLSIAVRLATRMSFAEARDVLGWFLPRVPSTEVVQGAALGYGRHTQEWFESASAPAGDGDVLIVMIDSKGAPTATDEELSKRRGPRRRDLKAPSPRHRGRQAREQWAKKPRRKKGDKAKNAKMATMVVMYTLQADGHGHLLGPINKRFYASFAPKRHAVEYARKQAILRGFAPATGKVVQIVTDGDDDLSRYITELFPDAIHTIDVVHVMERLWDAGTCVHREGSDELATWVESQKSALWEGRVCDIVAELRARLDRVAKSGPGNKWKRRQLSKALGYIEKRAAHMNYDELIARDLERASGPVEGAIKNIIGKRFDHGGMRWIRERAEAVLQLRCIDANGDWDLFAERVHRRAQSDAIRTAQRVRLQHSKPGPLPALRAAA